MEAKLAQRRLDLITLLNTPSVGSSIILAQFKAQLRQEAGALHAVIDTAVKTLKDLGRSESAKEIEAKVRDIYASPRQRRPIERLTAPSARRNLATRT
jgi:hypothetical protein